MGSRSDFFCWEIMQCENPDVCPAKKNPGMPCWEIAYAADDYRKANNICRDCIVTSLFLIASVPHPLLISFALLIPAIAIAQTGRRSDNLTNNEQISPQQVSASQQRPTFLQHPQWQQSSGSLCKSPFLASAHICPL